MKLTLAEPKYLKDSIAVISELVSEARFSIKKEGIEVIAMDPANVAMVIFKLLPSSFTEYNVDEPVEIGVNLNTFKQFLKRAKPADIVTLALDDNKLKIVLKSNSTRTFHLPIIDMDEGEQKIPDLNFPVSVIIDSMLLTEAIEDAAVVAESVAFILEKEKFIISAEGDLSKAKVEMLNGDDCKIIQETEDRIRAKYSVEYLKRMITASKLADTVTINFNNDYPLKMEYKTVDRLSLAFILAPRVEND